MLTANATDISVDITHSKQDPKYKPSPLTFPVFQWRLTSHVSGWQTLLPPQIPSLMLIKVPHLGCHPDNYRLLCEAAYQSLTTFLPSPDSIIHQLLRGFGGVGGGGAPMKFLGEAEPLRH